MAAGNLTTLEEVKAYLGLTASTSDDLLTALIERMSMWAQNVRMKRVIAVSSYQKVFMGTGQTSLVFSAWPAASIVSVVIGGATLQEDRDYWWTDTQLQLIGGWNFGPGLKCVVQWTAGYSEVPAELNQATIELVAFLYRQRDRIGLSAQTLGGAETTSYILDPATKEALAAFDAYRNVFPS